MSDSLDMFKRQARILETEQAQKTNITIFGLGTIGSNTAMCIGKMGVNSLMLVDYDTIELHNIANQIYGLDDIGEFKTVKCSSLMRTHTSTKVHTYSSKITEETNLTNIDYDLTNPIMILALDNLNTRKIIWDKIPDRTWVIDGRMSGEKITIFRIKKGSNSEVEKDYVNTFTQKIERGECGRESISYNGYMCASIIGKLTQEIINKTAEDIEVNVDLKNLLLYTNKM